MKFKLTNNGFIDGNGDPTTINEMINVYETSGGRVERTKEYIAIYQMVDESNTAEKVESEVIRFYRYLIKERWGFNGCL